MAVFNVTPWRRNIFFLNILKMLGLIIYSAYSCYNIKFKVSSKENSKKMKRLRTEHEV